MSFHHWKKYEDEILCACALAGRTDPKTIQILADMFGVSTSQLSFRLGNFLKLKKDPKTAWHCSKQERRVFWGLSLV